MQYDLPGTDFFQFCIFLVRISDSHNCSQSIDYLLIRHFLLSRMPSRRIVGQSRHGTKISTVSETSPIRKIIVETN